MMINIIAAVDEEFGFGKDGKIPWHYPEDFKYFREKTKGSTCIMGRKTFEDLLTYAKGKEVLPGRECIVVTSTQLDLGPVPAQSDEWKYKNIHRVDSISKALELSRNASDVFFIGGERIFESALKVVDCVYLTRIPGKFNCDRFFPRERLREKFVLYSTREGSDGLLYQTYLNNIYGNTNPLN